VTPVWTIIASWFSTHMSFRRGTRRRLSEPAPAAPDGASGSVALILTTNWPWRLSF
jgi:hypothetical protein